MKLTVKELAVSATVLAGRSGLSREVKSPQMVKPDLSAPSSWKGIASSVLHLTPGQIDYLCLLPEAERRKLAGELLRKKPACIVVSGGMPWRELLVRADAARIAVLKSRRLPQLTRVLVERLTPRVSMHGVLVEVFGIGVLIIGESAIGKSESALDLVLRGHKLVADDIVILEKTGDGIRGRPSDMGADLLQIRGLGIINIRALYGETATATTSMVRLVVELEEWHKGHHYSLLGLRERRHRILGRNIPYLKLPIKPGRNMATLIEVAARNQMLKNQGIYTARELNRRLARRLAV
jgi:HPr kinase/phosphorylase